MRQGVGTMDLKIQYCTVTDGATLLSCEGSGSVVHLPGQIGGLPLREIGAYAFSASGAAADHLPAGTEIRTAKVGELSAVTGGRTFLGGPLLREVMLPPEIRSIGTYAFYNCTRLSRIEFRAGAIRVGNGAFMNCGALREICFSAPFDASTCLPGLLTEIPHEVRVTFRSADETAVWIFPEYSEELVENSAAHIFVHYFEGAGYRYRQCFQGDRLNAENYDSQFPMAKSEADPATVLRIALERLRHPYRLSVTAAERYLSHLKEKAGAAAGLLIRDDDPDGLAFLAERGVFTRESIGQAVETAAHGQRAECLSILLEEQHSRFAPKEKTFDL